jgi:predicted amidohydrolase
MPKVALLQLEARPGRVQDTMDRIVDALVRAGRDGAAVLVAPELATTGYGAGAAFDRLAEGTDGPRLSRLAAVVEETGVALVTGFAERGADGLHNAAVVLAPGMAPVIYRKAQLYGDYERALFSPVPVSTVTTRVAGLTIGLLICFDVEFPEHTRRLALAGCDLIAVPTATPACADSVFIARSMIPTRAFENHVFVAYAGWSGADDAFAYAGCSVLAAPDGGEPLRAPAGGDFLGIADVEPSAFAETRAVNPYLAELRRS